MFAERRGVREVEVELQQIAQPHRATPERLQPISVGAGGVDQRHVDDRGLHERVDHRVAVERRLVLLLGRDPPYRLASAVDAGDRVAVGQRVEGGANTVGRPQPQHAVGDRSLFALEVIQRILQRVVQLVERQRGAAGGQQQRRHQPGRVDRGGAQDPP